jgi:hypothetical protein
LIDCREKLAVKKDKRSVLDKLAVVKVSLIALMLYFIG